MPFLYINSQGKPHSKHSYSAGLDFDQSAYKYFLKRVLGWKEKDDRASFKFGRALEESLQFLYERNASAVDDFTKRWAVHKNTSLRYTSIEKDWITCNKMGQDMIRLCQVMSAKLPIYFGGRSVWQREYSKEVFPGDLNYGGIEDAGRLDIISYAEPDHSMLPKIEWKAECGVYRPVIVDIKTAAGEFPEQPGMAAYDTQLRRYSWQSGIRDVALLWFVKKGLGFKKGYSVYLFEPTGLYQAGEEMVIAKLENDYTWLVKTDFLLDELDRVKKLSKEEDEDQTEQNWLDQNGVRVKLSDVTKQKLQFNAGRVSEQSANDAGQIAARQIVGIVNSWKTQSWPNTFSIRYPKDDRNDAYFRAFVLGDERFKEQNFTKNEVFEDLFEDTHEG